LCGIDLLSKKIIGRGIKRGGLYYLDDISKGVAYHVHYQFNSKEQEIWLWHHRLGHRSFGYLRHLFPNLFLHLQNVEFKCDTSLNKSSVPFSLIHSDVWGPSHNTTLSIIVGL